MTHDPLCPYLPEQQGFGGIDSGVPSTQPYIPSVPCQCDLIARVREDEETLVWQSAESMVREAQDAVVSIAAANQQFGYAAALRDAVEAVNAVPDGDSSAEWDRDYEIDKTGRTRNPRIWVREAVAAIEELGADQ